MFIKVALDDLGPVAIVFARTALGAAVLAPVAASRGALAPARGALGAIAALALMQIVAPFLLITVGEQHISSSLAGILVSAAPIFTALLAMRFDEAERSRGWGLAGVVIGIAGVALLFGVDLTGGWSQVGGGLAVLAASLGYAVGALFLKHRLRGVPPLGIVTATMAVSALALVPVLPFALPGHAPGPDTVGALLMLGAGGTGLAFLIFYTLIADVGPARASLVAYVAPGFAVLYGAALLGESITVATVAGLVLILAGSYLAAEGRLPWRPRPLEPVGELSEVEGGR